MVKANVSLVFQYNYNFIKIKKPLNFSGFLWSG